MSELFPHDHLIRPLGPSDLSSWWSKSTERRLDQLNHLLSIASPSSPPRTAKDILRLIKSGNIQVWVLHDLELDEFVAMASLVIPTQLSRGQAQLADLAVHADFRGSAAARLVCQAVLLKARREGIRNLEIAINATDSSAGQLLTALGWERRTDTLLFGADPRLLDTTQWPTSHIVQLNVEL